MAAALLDRTRDRHLSGRQVSACALDSGSIAQAATAARRCFDEDLVAVDDAAHTSPNRPGLALRLRENGAEGLAV